MKVPRRTAFALSSAVVLIVILTLCLAANLMNAVGAPKPRILQSSPLLIWQKGHICSAKGQPNCSLARGNASAAPGDRKGMSAVANVTSANSGAKFPSAPLARCSTATLLGAWDNNTLVPLPYDGFAPFLAEARGVLSPGERNLFIKQRNGTDVLPKYLPVDYPIGSFAKPPEEEPLPFSPPCYYHFYSKDEILRLFTGKWVFFFGDSNTRGMVLGLLAILDLDHRSPYSDAKWFNTSAEEIGWPHTSSLHYFFKEDGSILFKTGAWRDPPPLPEGGFTFRLSFKMTFDVEELTESVQEVLGGGSWAPHVLYFSSGAWDSGKLLADPGNWTFARFDRSYGRFFDMIARDCAPKRQVCFWGTVGQVPREIYWHDALAVLQWRNVARTVARQIDAGNMTTLHLIDWFWPSFGRLDQRFGGHRTKGFNLWVSQLVVNAYHSIAEQRGLISPAVSLVQPSRSYRAEEVECFLLPVVLGVQGRKVKCKKYPLRVGFEKGCMVENQTDYPEIGKRTLTLWARNCTPQVIV